MRPELGSTTFEALAAILLLGVAGAAALGAASSGIRAFGAGREAAVSAARVLAFDDALRERAREIRVPYWERRAGIDKGAGAAGINYWMGRKDKRLEISDSGAGLALSTPRGTRTFPGIRLKGVFPEPEGEGPARGIRVEYSAGEREFSSTAEFGSWALGEDEP